MRLSEDFRRAGSFFADDFPRVGLEKVAEITGQLEKVYKESASTSKLKDNPVTTSSRKLNWFSNGQILCSTFGIVRALCYSEQAIMRLYRRRRFGRVNQMTLRMGSAGPTFF